MVKHREIVEKYLKKYPDLSKKKLAELMSELEPSRFPSAELARSAVRFYTRANGKWSKTNDPLGDLSSIKEGLQKRNIFTYREAAKPIILPKGRYGILSDLHFPDHDQEAVAIALSYMVDYNPDGIILNGDLIDMYYSSSFLTETNKPTIRQEVDMVKEFLGYLRELFPTIPIWYKFGNHEERARNSIIRNARFFADLEEISLEHLLKLKEFKIKQVGREIIKAGKLNILHGHEMGESIMAPVNPARGMFLKAKASVLAGHNHQVSEHGESTVNGEQIVCYSTGCLCTLSPEYRPMAYMKWAHGFATVEVLEKGMFKVRNMKIVNGEIV